MPDLVRMLVATLDTRLEWSLPDASAVEDAFEEAARSALAYWVNVGIQREQSGTPPGEGAWNHPGDWAGPVRITRRNRATGYTLTAAAPFIVPAYSPAEMQAHRLTEESASEWQERALGELEHQLDRHLTELDRDFVVRTTSFNPAINGALAWWHSGQASRTQSRFAPPGSLGLGDPVENPVGPSSRDLRPATTQETFQTGLSTLAKPVIIGGLIIVGIYLVTRE